MGKYTDDEIRAMPKITAKIAADYLGISPMMVTLGMRNNVLPIGSTLFLMPNWIRHQKRGPIQRKLELQHYSGTVDCL